MPSAAGDQDFGPNGAEGSGRNGVEVFKAEGVSVENLTACNFLEGRAEGGNEIWFNGGDGSGQDQHGRVPGRLPLGDLDLLRGPARPPAPTGSSLELAGARE